jgi:hypothetical protein
LPRATQGAVSQHPTEHRSELAVGEHPSLECISQGHALGA